MADPNDPKVAKELAEAMKAVGEYAEEAAGAFEQQLKVVSQMRDAMEEVAKVMYALCQQDCKALNPDAWKAVTKEVLKNEKAVKSTSKSFKELAKTLEKDFAKAAYVAAGAIGGLAQGFKNVFALGKSFLGLVGSVAGAVWEIGKSILSIPLKIMEGLFSMASKGGSNELDTALQGIVKKFGDLEGPAARAITNTAKSFAKVNEGGIDMYRVFGNLADRVKAVQEMAEGMGATYSVFTDEVNKNGVALAIYQKGLGISKEEMEGLARTALRTDKSMSDVAKDMTKYSQELSKAFGVPAKVISADMAKAMKDLAHFGHLAEKEMAVTAAFANKLGVSVDKLTSIMDATKTYDQTAESVSKLNETLGTNIDSTKLMMLAEKGGGAQLEYLRSELKRAGKDLGNLDYFQRNLIKSTNLLSDDLINSALAKKNDAVSMDAMAKSAEKVEKKTYEQKDALKDLKKEIEKRPLEGMLGSGGIFDRLMQGFSMGIERSPIFMKLMMNLREIFREVYWAGYRMGQMFVNFFPGVKDIIEGLAGIFNPSRFRNFFSEIEKIFKNFSAEGGKDVNGLLKSLQDNFLNFFDKSSPAGQKVIDGFEKFWSVIAAVLNKVLEIVIGKMADIVNAITDFLVNPRIPSGATGVLNAVASPFQDAFNALADKLWPATQRFFGVLWDKVKDFLLNDPTGQKIVSGAIALVLAPAILGGLANALAAGLFKGFSTMFFEGMAKSLVTNKKGVTDVGTSIASSVKAATDASKNIPEAAASGTNISKMIVNVIPEKNAMDKLSAAEQIKVNWHKVGQFLAGLAGFLTIGLLAFAAALYIVKDVPISDVIAAGIVLGTVSLMMLPAAALIQSLDKMEGKIDPKKAGQAAAAIGVFMIVGLLAALGGIAIVAAAKPSIANIMLTASVAAAMVPLFAAAGLAAGAAALIGKMKVDGGDLVKGGVVLIAAVGLIGLTAWGIVKASKGLDEESVKKAKLLSQVMSDMAGVFLKMSGVVVVAAGIGAALGVATFFGGGIGAAIAGGALFAGLAAIKAVVSEFTDTTIGIINKLADIKGTGSDLESRANIFFKIGSLVTDLASKIKDILSALDFGFFESQESKRDRMQKVVDIINGLSKAITDVVSGVVNQLSSSGLTPDKVKMAEALANIISSAGNMISGIAKVMGPFLDAIRYFPKSDMGKYNQFLDDLKVRFDEMGKSLQVLVENIVSNLNKIQSPEKLAAASKGISEIFGAIISLFGVLGPKVEQIQEEAGRQATGGTTRFDKMTEWIRTMSRMMGVINVNLTGKDGLLTKLIPILTGELSKLSEGQLKGMGSLGSVLSGIASLITTVTSSATSETTSKYEKNASGVAVLKEKIEKTAPSLDGLFDVLIQKAPALVSKMIELAQSTSTVKEADIKKIEAIFNSISSMMNTVGHATESSNWREAAEWAKSAGNNNYGPIQEMAKQLGFVYNFLQLLHGDTLPGVDKTASLSMITEKIRALSVSDEVAGKAKAVASLLETIAKINKAIIDATTSPIDFGDVNSKSVEFGRSLYVSYHVLDKLEKGVEASGNTKEGENGPGSIFSFAEKIRSINTSLAGGNYTLEGIKWTSQNVSSVLTEVSGMLKKVTEISMPSESDVNVRLDTIKKSLEALKIKSLEIAEVLPKNELDKRIRSIADTGAEANLAALSDVIAHANKVSQQFSKLPTIAVPAQLEAFASGLGFNGSYQYKIQSQGVQINLEIHVTMDADKVEKAIVNRQTSVIRDRINYIMEQSPIKTQAITDSAYIVEGPVSTANKAKEPHVAPT